MPDREQAVRQVVVPGSAAVGFGTVWHRRNVPTPHEFTYRVNQVWLDPDHPEVLFGRHPLWSAAGPRPIRFRRRDYLDGTQAPIGPAVRAALRSVRGAAPRGPVRMLTQPRTWGWVFNPITVYLVWDGDDRSDPAGAVLEVTNTPWKERTLYPLALEARGDRLAASFDKTLHVSPFLDEDYRYDLWVRQTGPNCGPEAGGRNGAGAEAGRRLQIGIDVRRSQAEPPTVETALDIELHHPDRPTMTAALYRNLAATHRVSLGIHWQAARLAAKRIPFISHPGKRS